MQGYLFAKPLSCEVLEETGRTFVPESLVGLYQWRREAKDIAQSLIRLEDQLVKDMRPYL